VTNAGNTSVSYRVKVVGDARAVRRPLRLLVAKVQRTPTTVGCEVVEEEQTSVLLDVVDPEIEPVEEDTIEDDDAPAEGEPAPAELGSRGAGSPSAADTFALRPGETAYVTLRGHPEPGEESSVLDAVVPVVVPESGSGGSAAALMVLPAGGELPTARYGVSYSATLRAFGGRRPYSWTGTLPGGLTVEPSGRKVDVSGVPLAVGRHQAVVRVTDGRRVPSEATRTFVLRVRRARTEVEIEAPSQVSAGLVPVVIRVVPEGEGAPTGAVLVEGGDGERCTLAAPGGTCTLEFREAGERRIKARYEGDGNFQDEEASFRVLVEGPGSEE
jgi:hypothetical protein